MKKILFYILGICLCCSCEKNSEEMSIQTQSDLATKSIIENDSIDVLIVTEEDIIAHFSSNGEFEAFANQQIPSSARAYIDSRTVTGCHSCTARSGMENLKEAFYNQELCDKIGISQGIYITDECEAKITLYTGEGEQLIPTESPNCGIQPDGGGIRGYSAYFVGNKIILTTYLTHIKYDMLGRLIDIWYPVNPNDLIWNYDIYLPHWN